MPSRSIVLLFMFILLTCAIGFNVIFNNINNDIVISTSEEVEIEVEEPKPVEDKKHKFNMISYTVELTYWDGKKDTVTYKYVRDVFELTIRDGNLRCTRTDDEDVNGDGTEDFSKFKEFKNYSIWYRCFII